MFDISLVLADRSVRVDFVLIQMDNGRREMARPKQTTTVMDDRVKDFGLEPVVESVDHNHQRKLFDKFLFQRDFLLDRETIHSIDRRSMMNDHRMVHVHRS